MEILGIDIGGSGMKGALVDMTTGKMTTERFRIPTPTSKKPKDMAETLVDIVKHFNYNGPIGIGFPSIIKNGVCKSQSNLHKSWIGVQVDELFSNATGMPVTVINDADAAGNACMTFGVGKDIKGLVIMITIGTGLGSGAFIDGKLLPNFELGQIPYKEYKKIELYAADSAKERDGLSYKQWGKRFNKFLNYVDLIVSPDLIILGGGISKNWKEFAEYIDLDTEVIPAKLRNKAGIIGAAAAAMK